MLKLIEARIYQGFRERVGEGEKERECAYVYEGKRERNRRRGQVKCKTLVTDVEENEKRGRIREKIAKERRKEANARQ